MTLRRLSLSCQTAIAMAVCLAVGGIPAHAQQNSAPAPSQALPPSPSPMPLPMPGRPEGGHRSTLPLDIMSKMSDPAAYVDRYRETLEFAQCASRVTPQRVASLLKQPPGSPAERRAANSLMRFAPGCLGHSFVISIRLLRGASAEAVLRNYRSAEPDTVKTVSSTRLERFFDATPDSEQLDDEGARELLRFTQCQVMLAPGLVRRLLEEKPGSNGEKAPRLELAEVGSPCGRMAIETEIAALLYRSYLAEALYHWTRSNGKSSLS